MNRNEQADTPLGRRDWLLGVLGVVLLVAFFVLTYQLDRGFATRWKQLREGLSSQQVVELLGEPTSRDVNAYAFRLFGGADVIWRYEFEDRDGRKSQAVVYLRDEKVTRWYPE